jgi:ABC-type transporter Mla MlaB component
MTEARALPTELTIYTVGETHPQCLAWLDGTAGSAGDELLEVDASSVSEVDAAGVQLLLSLANALAAQQRALRLIAPSAVLAAACEALGATALTSPDRSTGAAA